MDTVDADAAAVDHHSTTGDPFDCEFRFWRQLRRPGRFNQTPLNHDDALDILGSSLSATGQSQCEFADVDATPAVACNDTLSELGLRHPSQWLISVAPDGLTVVRDAFTAEGQCHWLCRCLFNYSRSPPYVNNLREVGGASTDWIDDVVANAVWDDKRVNALRWSTMGYHHNWTTKEYCEDSRSPFPTDLARLVTCIVRHVAHCTSDRGVTHYDDAAFHAEAAIVNYYPMNGQMRGHADVSERDLSQPLVSISLGQSAVFMVGGSEKSAKPARSMLVRSGDVVLLAGQSRTAVHAMPRIIEDAANVQRTLDAIRPSDNDSQYGNDDNSSISSEQKYAFVRRYIASHRINISVRQVNRWRSENIADS